MKSWNALGLKTMVCLLDVKVSPPVSTAFKQQLEKSELRSEKEDASLCGARPECRGGQL